MNFPLAILRVVLRFLPAFSVLLLSKAGEVQVTRGTLEGANYMVAAPADWRGNMLLLAHGYRDTKNPLDGDFDQKGGLAGPLLERGWLVASTSYRRNGWIVEDAISDLRALVAEVKKTKGEVKRLLVVGNSMGGLIATLCAEGALEGTSGVVALGAYLGDGKTEDFHPLLSWKPKVALIFLTNQSELDHPRHYRKKAGQTLSALWEIKRNGHCNASDAERLQAVLAVNDWLEGKEIPRERDGTLALPERDSTARKEAGALVGKVSRVTASWGNLTTTLVAGDLRELGLKLGDKARLKTAKGLREVTVCAHFSEVAAGEIGLFVTPEGWAEVVVNSGRASEVLGVAAGDELWVLRKAAPGK